MIEVESHYIEFQLCGQTAKTEKWQVLNKKHQTILGRIEWYWAWTQYCFFPSPNCIFNITCLEDISKALKQLNSQSKKGKSNE